MAKAVAKDINIGYGTFEAEISEEKKDGQEIKTDKRGSYYQKSPSSKKRYFDPDKPMDRERARRVSSRD